MCLFIVSLTHDPNFDPKIIMGKPKFGCSSQCTDSNLMPINPIWKNQEFDANLAMYKHKI
jgi:hypothetical protein